jgi:hypothetical protein
LQASRIPLNGNLCMPPHWHARPMSVSSLPPHVSRSR